MSSKVRHDLHKVVMNICKHVAELYVYQGIMDWDGLGSKAYHW